MNINIEEIEFTVFDTETTGLHPAQGDRIVELAGLKVRGQEKLARFDCLVNPHREISAGAFAVNKITPEMLKHAPDLSTVMPKFLEFIGGSCLCSYNAEFDLGFLNAELKLSGRPPLAGIVVLDVLTMARKLLPGLPRYPLWAVAQKLGIVSPQAHRAFADVELTWEVFNQLKSIGAKKGIFGFTAFSELFAYNPVLAEGVGLEKITRIQKCIQEKKILKFSYASSTTGEISQREIIPQEIRQDNQTRYLVGYCCLKKEQRTFRLENILNLEVI
jgi:DNA polymerase III epsilon subunit family exonuclease